MGKMRMGCIFDFWNWNGKPRDSDTGMNLTQVFRESLMIRERDLGTGKNTSERVSTKLLIYGVTKRVTVQKSAEPSLATPGLACLTASVRNSVAVGVRVKDRISEQS